MYTSHGHHIDGTVNDGLPKSVARCGGPVLCSVCSVEAVKFSSESLIDTYKKELIMDFTTYVRKPFTVEATEITLENIEELAPLVGTSRRST